MSAAAAAIAGWVAETPLIDGVLFGSSDWEVEGPPVCAVAVAGNLRGYGKGYAQSQALASAVGELLELVAATRVDRQRLIHTPFEEIAPNAFDPRWLGLYSGEQYRRAGFPFQPFDPRTPLHWLEGRWLDTNDPVYLPAFAVYLSDELIPEALCQVTSSGLGASVEHAVLELYERHAFLASWMSLLPKRKLSSVADPGGILAHLKSRGADIGVYLLSDSPVCVAAAVASGDGVHWPAFTLGLGAAHDLEDAVEKAILELGQTSPYLARIWRRAEAPLPKSPQDIKTLQDHALYYCDPAHRPEFEPFVGRDLAAQGRLMPCALGTHRIAIVDITPAELRDSPYRIVRALARGLQSIHCGHGFERLNSYPVKNPAPCPLC